MGPLHGVKIVEFAGIGPGPFAAMMLADMGADVLRIDRSKKGGGGGLMTPAGNLLNRNRRSAAVNLKTPEGVALALRLVEKADASLEGFRPGVMERLGLGPEVCLERNPRLVYGRMTGWGQEGPLADAAGHDINYISLAGVLHHIGTAGGPPVPPLNLVGDFGGGGMMLAYGVVCGLLEAARSGKGQVVDAAMVDGAAVLMTLFHAMRLQGIYFDERGVNTLDSGAHFYNTYRTSDGKYVSIGSIEPQFYARLLELTGLDREELPDQVDPNHWPKLKERLQAVFETRTRDQWCELMEGTDVCFAPVLTIPESMEHSHMKARNTYVEVDGIRQPAPAPRFSRTPGAIDRPPPLPGQHTDETLREWGIPDADISQLHDSGAIE